MICMKRFYAIVFALLISSSVVFAQSPIQTVDDKPMIAVIKVLAGDVSVHNDAQIPTTMKWSGRVDLSQTRASIDQMLTGTQFQAVDRDDGIHVVQKDTGAMAITGTCGPEISSIECVSLENMRRRQDENARHANSNPGCGPSISWIECASYSSMARHRAEVRASSYGWSPSFASGWSPFNRGYDDYGWGCPSGLPTAELPPECMGAIKFRIGTLTGINLEEVDCRIDGRKCPAVGAHSRWWQSTIKLPPGDHHIVLLTKTEQIRMFEDMITVHPLLQTGNKAFEVTVSDADFRYGLFTGTVQREHRTVKAGELLKR